MKIESSGSNGVRQGVRLQECDAGNRVQPPRDGDSGLRLFAGCHCKHFAYDRQLPKIQIEGLNSRSNSLVLDFLAHLVLIPWSHPSCSIQLDVDHLQNLFCRTASHFAVYPNVPCHFDFV